jgi:CHAT domain-containing protein
LRKNNDAADWQLRKCSFQKQEIDYQILGAVETKGFDLESYCSWREIKKHLKRDEAAIEFVSFPVANERNIIMNYDSVEYAALVVRSTASTPVWIPLCTESDLQNLLPKRAIANEKGFENTFHYTKNGKQLYELLWQKLEKELSGVNDVYYSPSGLLHKLSFDAIPVSNNQYLSEKYNLHLVSSTREIKNVKSDKGISLLPSDTVTVYGGLDYGLNKNESGDYTMTQEDLLQEGELYASRAGLSSWKYLKGTQTEAENLVQILDNHNIKNQYYQGTRGIEESFKALSGKNNAIISIGTHGFFLQDVEKGESRALLERLGGQNTATPNPLLRSGLIMSGGNYQWKDRRENIVSDMDDGILTAAEVAQMNLTKTSLVVLSACESGLGEVNNSEGVFGLQRGFKIAGVQTLIMSLWQVSDEATQLFMTTFYENLVNHKKTKAQSYKTAQQTVRERYPSPYFWAAFVMMD